MKPSLKRIRKASEILFSKDVFVKSRKRDFVRKRQVTHYVSHVIFGHALRLVGAEFGNLNHATVLHSCKVVEAEKDYYPEINSDVLDLVAMSKHKEQSLLEENIIHDILKYSDVNVNVKIQLRKVLHEILLKKKQ